MASIHRAWPVSPWASSLARRWSVPPASIPYRDRPVPRPFPEANPEFDPWACPLELFMSTTLVPLARFQGRIPGSVAQAQPWVCSPSPSLIPDPWAGPNVAPGSCPAPSSRSARAASGRGRRCLLAAPRLMGSSSLRSWSSPPAALQQSDGGGAVIHNARTSAVLNKTYSVLSKPEMTETRPLQSRPDQCSVLQALVSCRKADN